MKNYDYLLDYGYISLEDFSNHKIYLYANPSGREVIIQPCNLEDITVKVYENVDLDSYAIIANTFDMILKFYKYFEKDKRKYEQLNFINSEKNEIRFISDNTFNEIANQFIIKKITNDSINYFELQTLYNSDEIIGSLILLTSSSNSGKYGEYYNYIRNMINSLSEKNKVFTKK